MRRTRCEAHCTCRHVFWKEVLYGEIDAGNNKEAEGHARRAFTRGTLGLYSGKLH